LADGAFRPRISPHWAVAADRQPSATAMPSATRNVPLLDAWSGGPDRPSEGCGRRWIAKPFRQAQTGNSNNPCKQRTGSAAGNHGRLQLRGTQGSVITDPHSGFVQPSLMGAAWPAKPNPRGHQWPTILAGPRACFTDRCPFEATSIDDIARGPPVSRKRRRPLFITSASKERWYRRVLENVQAAIVPPAPGSSPLGVWSSKILSPN